MKTYFFAVMLITVIIFASCEKPHSKTQYIPLVEELHKIECEQLKIAGINFLVNDTNIYTFRGIAFDRIMTKKPNAPLIAHYEELYQKLAVIEFNMDDYEKLKYREDVKSEYLKPCK
ncbi:MAG: hypothetical protein ABI543_06130 [Ignavibacteria bacterium]